MSALGFVQNASLEMGNLIVPHDLSFFAPFLGYHIKETLEVGGEVYVSRTSDGDVSGVFIYDECEKGGTIYTKSRDVFDYFFGLKRFNFLFAEMRTEHRCETYDIYIVDLEGLAVSHKFRHEITVANGGDAGDIERFMVATHPGINKRWVNVALKNGDKCVIVRLGTEIAGLGWLSLVNDIGRLHSLYVKPRFRGMGIGEDILHARLMWCKSKNTRMVFSEISRDNLPSSKIAMKGNMRASGQVFQYSRNKEVQALRSQT